MLDTVGFDDRHVVTIDRNVEESIAGCIDNAKPVPLGLNVRMHFHTLIKFAEIAPDR